GSTIWKNEVQMITIMVSSENSGGGVKEEYSFYVRQHGMHIPGFDPTFAIISLALVGAVIMRKRTQGSDDEEYLI
ncbi:MAG: hypothetical protein KAT70_02435, partial [Thermoplasmata archaeon]|nr:hypothetical protein [Thermoplasmata archaeon]